MQRHDLCTHATRTHARGALHPSSGGILITIPICVKYRTERPLFAAAISCPVMDMMYGAARRTGSRSQRVAGGTAASRGVGSPAAAHPGAGRLRVRWAPRAGRPLPPASAARPGPAPCVGARAGAPTLAVHQTRRADLLLVCAQAPSAATRRRRSSGVTSSSCRRVTGSGGCTRGGCRRGLRAEGASLSGGWRSKRLRLRRLARGVKRCGLCARCHVSQRNFAPPSACPQATWSEAARRHVDPSEPAVVEPGQQQQTGSQQQGGQPGQQQRPGGVR